jgi:hypothetical protein
MVTRALPSPSNAIGPKVWVYGYLPSWIVPSDQIAWDKLSHVAIFKVGLAADGSLTGTSHWKSVAPTVMALGAPYGVRVHLTVACFDKTVMTAVLPKPAVRAKMVAALGDLVDAEGAHGVSIDFEFMPAALKDDLTAFIEELKQRVAEVTVATPAVDWANAYDYDKLAAAADALFIMGYDYHWTSGNPGPVAPMKGGGIWSAYALDWTFKNYLAAGAPKDKLIMGLPLYGYRWPTTNNEIPGSATGSATAVLMADAVDQVNLYEGYFDDQTQTPYYFPSASKQVFCDDKSSLGRKIGWALEQDVKGIGFWALGYDGGDSSFWDMVGAQTQGGEGDGGVGGGGIGGGGVGGGGGAAEPSGGGSTSAAAGNAGSGSVEGVGAGDPSAPGCGCATVAGTPTATLPLLAALLGFAGRARGRRRSWGVSSGKNRAR